MKTLSICVSSGFRVVLSPSSTSGRCTLGDWLEQFKKAVQDENAKSIERAREREREKELFCKKMVDAGSVFGLAAWVRYLMQLAVCWAD